MAMEKVRKITSNVRSKDSSLLLYPYFPSVYSRRDDWHPQFSRGAWKIVFIPMVFTMLLSLIFTPDVLGRAVPAFKKFVARKK